MRRIRHAVIGLVIALAVPAVAAPAAHAAPTPAPQPAAAPLVVRGSVHQVQVLHAPTGAWALLFEPGGTVSQFKAVDSLGGALFHNVAAGDGYGIWIWGPGTSIVRQGIHVLSETETPAPSFYSGQHLNEGYGYLTTRDGTQLSIDVVLPGHRVTVLSSDHGGMPPVASRFPGSCTRCMASMDGLYTEAHRNVVDVVNAAACRPCPTRRSPERAMGSA